MNEQYLDIDGSKMSYLQFGNGSDLLIALPGYGDRAVLFERLKESLSKRYTVYVLQLPLHGESYWAKKSFTKKDFIEAINQIKEKEQKEKVSLMGFSFGARAVCSMLGNIHSMVSELFLLAPDGFNKEYVNRATLLPKSVRYFLQATLSNPAWYLGIVKGLGKIGMLKKSSLHFAERHLATEKRRKRLFLYWNSIDDFQYDEEVVGLLLEDKEIPTTLILGKQDYVIPTKKWKHWGAKYPIVNVYLLEEGHRLVGEGMNDLLKTLV